MRNLALCDIGDGQDILDNLSTFSAHITNVLEILKRATGESLVILDELGSGCLLYTSSVEFTIRYKELSIMSIVPVMTEYG